MPWGSASLHPRLSSHLPSGFQIAASKPATRMLQLAPKAHQDNSLGCKAQDHLEKERALQARWKNCVTKGKRLTNYTTDDVGGLADAFRSAQATGVSTGVWLICQSRTSQSSEKPRRNPSAQLCSASTV